MAIIKGDRLDLPDTTTGLAASDGRSGEVDVELSDGSVERVDENSVVSDRQRALWKWLQTQPHADKRRLSQVPNLPGGIAAGLVVPGVQAVPIYVVTRGDESLGPPHKLLAEVTHDGTTYRVYK